MNTKIIIYVAGGVVHVVETTNKLNRYEVILVDEDNIAAGDPDPRTDKDFPKANEVVQIF